MAHKTCAIAGKKLQRDHGQPKAVPHPKRRAADDHSSLHEVFHHEAHRCRGTVRNGGVDSQMTVERLQRSGGCPIPANAQNPRTSLLGALASIPHL
jgi:hypothetical protein